MLVTLTVIEMYWVRQFLSFPSDGDVLITYRGRMKELILIFEQRLRLAYESEYSVLHDFFNSLSCWDVVKHSFIHFQFSHTHTPSTKINRLLDVLSITFQLVLHDWCNKSCGMCYPVCGIVHIKELLLLIDKSSLCGGSGFPFSLSEWSFTICLMPYNRK